MQQDNLEDKARSFLQQRISIQGTKNATFGFNNLQIFYWREV